MAISSVVSNFELLVKPLVQPSADILGAGRTIIQGYFLSISNLNSNSAVTLRLNFRAQTSNISANSLLAFWDVNGNNSLLNPVFSNATNQIYQVTVPARDTGLFILQPNVAEPKIVDAANTELRGYLVTSLASPFGTTKYNLLLSPEHRGTFLPRGYKVPKEITKTTRQDFDQLAYSIPTGQGGTQFELEQIRFTLPRPDFPLQQLPEFELDPELGESLRPSFGNGSNGRQLQGAAASDLQQVLSTMIDRIDNLEQRAVEV